jgi:hypothetical protein
MAAGYSKPVLYYTFENGSGTTVTDRSNAGNGLSGSFTSTPTWDSTNKKRGSYSMNFGAGDAIGNGKDPPDSDSIGDLTTFNFIHQTCVWTISMWVRQTTAAYHAFCGNVAGTGNGITIMYYLSKIRALGHGVNITFAGSGLTADTWTHVLVTCDGPGAGNLKCYMDGVQTGGDQSGGVIKAGDQTDSWAVGNTGYANGLWSTSFSGQMDEYSIWDVAFDTDDVAAIYGSGTPPDISDGLYGPAPAVVGKIGTVAAASVKRILGIDAVGAGKIKNVMGLTNPSTAWSFSNTYSLDLNGTSEYLKMDTVSALNFEWNDAFSVSCWFKAGLQSQWATLVQKIDFGSWSDIKGWAISSASGRVGFIISNDWNGGAGPAAFALSNATSGFFDSNWHHFVATLDGSGTVAGMTIYIDDGVETTYAYLDESDIGGNTMTTTADIIIGSNLDPATGGYNGLVDEVSIWNKELSSAEVSEIYNSGSPARLAEHSAASSLLSWWRMGDGSGDSSDSSDSGARIYDQSGNSYDMTPVGTVAGDIQTDVP